MEKFDRTSRLLHWLSALVIVWASLSGLYAATLASNIELKDGISYFNVSITTLLIPFFTWRIVHCWRRRSPPPLDSVSPFQQHAAKLAHVLLYTITVIVLISGVLMMDRPIDVFNLWSFTNPVKDSGLLKHFSYLHNLTSQLLICIVVIHVGAVIKHQWAGKNVLQRML